MCTPRNTYRVVMFGLENAGKTTIVNNFSKSKKSCIRISPNIQHFDWGPLRVTSLDVGCKLPNRKNVFNGAKAVIFVLDSTDYKRFEEAQSVFWAAMKNPRLKRVLVLVLANKCDCAGALLPKQVEDKLGLQCLGRKFKVVRSQAMTLDGVCEGLTWLKCELSPPRRSCIKLLSEFLGQLSSNEQKCQERTGQEQTCQEQTCQEQTRQEQTRQEQTC